MAVQLLSLSKESNEREWNIELLIEESKIMRKNFGVKPFTYPQPVFIIATYDEDRYTQCHECSLGRH